MKKLLLFAVFSLCLVLTTGAFASPYYKNEPAGFQNFAWGCYRSEVERSYRLVFLQDIADKNVREYTLAGQKTLYNIDMASITLGFFKDKLFSAQAFCYNDREKTSFNKLVNNLAAQHGRPTQVTNNYLKKTTTHYWQGDKTLITLSHNIKTYTTTLAFYSDSILKDITAWQVSQAHRQNKPQN